MENNNKNTIAEALKVLNRKQVKLKLNVQKLIAKIESNNLKIQALLAVLQQGGEHD